MKEGGNTSSASDAVKKPSRIHTLAEAQDCLLVAKLIKPDDTMPPDMLAGALVQIMFFLGLSQAAKDAVCSVVLLLAQMKPASMGKQLVMD